VQVTVTRGTANPTQENANRLAKRVQATLKVAGYRIEAISAIAVVDVASETADHQVPTGSGPQGD
jgi:hypothetical protein